MIVGLPGSPANQLPLASDSFTVDAELLPFVAVLGAVAGIWVFFKVLELLRRLFVPVLVGAAIVLLTQTGIEWPFGGEAAATVQTPDIPPLGDFLPPR